MPLHPFPGALGMHRNAVSRSNAVYATTATHTTGGTAHTWGTPTQLVASTSYDAHWILLKLNVATGASTVRSDSLIQLYVGGAGSETSIVGPIACGFRSSGSFWWLPVFIPSGSRVSFALKSNRTALGMAVVFDYFQAGTRDHSGWPQRWVSYGLVDNSTDSHGTSVTAGSTNAWGSWTSLTTSTTYDHDLWLPIWDGYTNSNTTALNYRSQFAIASTGDAATMVTNGTVFDGPAWATTAAETSTDQLTSTGAWAHGVGSNGLIYAPRASGASVSMRAMCSGTAEASVAGSILAAVM